MLKAVNDGEIDAGIIYHYYWYRDQAESGANSDNTELHFFGNQDPGAFVSVSGAGVLKSSEHQDDAQQFVEYLTSNEGQHGAGRQLRARVPAQPRGATSTRRQAARRAGAADGRHLRTLNGPRVIELMQEAGLL